MAIYQPSNVVPSTFAGAGGGTIESTDNISVSWQVNGNSPLVSFQIDFYKNDATSTFIGTTGIKNDNCPFYGTDNKGNPNFFTYNSDNTWASLGIADGEEYKLKITQFWGSVTRPTFHHNFAIGTNNKFYIKIGDLYYYATNTTGAYIPVTQDLLLLTDKMMCLGGYEVGKPLKYIPCAISTSAPSGYSNLAGTAGTADVPNIVEQYSESCFISRSAPSLIINSFADPLDVVTNIFTATYTQAQNDSINSVRWRLFNNTSKQVLEDTGDINTSVLSFKYDGFFSGSSYTLTCTVITESGITVSDSKTFSVQYEMRDTSNKISVSCENDGSVLVSWAKATDIEGIPTPDNYGNIDNGVLSLNAGASINWNMVTGKAMRFSPPFAVAWKGKISSIPITATKTVTISGETSAKNTKTTLSTGINVTGESTTTEEIVSGTATLQNGTVSDYVNIQTVAITNSTTQEISGFTDEIVYPPANISTEYTPASMGYDTQTFSVFINKLDYSRFYGETGVQSFTLGAIQDVSVNSGTNQSYVTIDKVNNTYNIKVYGAMKDYVSVTATIAYYEAVRLVGIIPQNFDKEVDVLTVQVTSSNNTFSAQVESFDNETYVVLAKPKNDGGSSVTVRITYDTLYKATYIGFFSQGYGIKNVTASPGAGAVSADVTQFSGNSYTVVIYSNYYDSNIFATVYIEYIRHYSGTSVRTFSIGGIESVSASPGNGALFASAQIISDTEYSVTVDSGSETTATAVVYITYSSGYIVRVEKSFDSGYGIVSVSAVPLGNAVSATAQKTGNTTYSVTIGAADSGDVSAKVTFTYISLYKGEVSKTFEEGYGIVGVEAIPAQNAVSATAQKISDTTYSVTVFADKSGIAYADVNITYISDYRNVSTNTFNEGYGIISVSAAAGTGAIDAEAQKLTDTTYSVTIFTDTVKNVSANVTIVYIGEYEYSPQSTIVSLGGTNLTLNRENGNIVVYQGQTVISTFNVPVSATNAVIAIDPQKASIWFIDDVNTLIKYSTSDISYTQSEITSVSLYGKQECDYLYITNNIAYDFSSNEYLPIWDSDTLFFADFNGSLQAGTIGASGDMQSAVYRVQNGILSILGYTPTARVTQMKDFGAKSMNDYYYDVYYLSDNIYSTHASSRNVCLSLKAYFLMEAEQDISNSNIYHVIKTWIFSNNIGAPTVSNNNSPNLLQNFTRYRLRQPSSLNSKSGVLQALLGNAENASYNDTAEMMNDLFDLSNTEKTLFLKDMKGNLYMVHTSDPITQTINTNSGKQEVTINLPWEEIGDTTGLALIQLPTDEGWDV